MTGGHQFVIVLLRKPPVKPALARSDNHWPSSWSRDSKVSVRSTPIDLFQCSNEAETLESLNSIRTLNFRHIAGYYFRWGKGSRWKHTVHYKIRLQKLSQHI